MASHTFVPPLLSSPQQQQTLSSTPMEIQVATWLSLLQRNTVSEILRRILTLKEWVFEFYRFFSIKRQQQGVADENIALQDVSIDEMFKVASRALIDVARDDQLIADIETNKESVRQILHSYVRCYATMLSTNTTTIFTSPIVIPPVATWYRSVLTACLSEVKQVDWLNIRTLQDHSVISNWVGTIVERVTQNILPLNVFTSSLTVGGGEGQPGVVENGSTNAMIPVTYTTKRETKAQDTAPSVPETKKSSKKPEMDEKEETDEQPIESAKYGGNGSGKKHNNEGDAKPIPPDSVDTAEQPIEKESEMPEDTEEEEAKNETRERFIEVARQMHTETDEIPATEERKSKKDEKEEDDIIEDETLTPKTETSVRDLAQNAENASKKPTKSTLPDRLSSASSSTVRRLSQKPPKKFKNREPVYRRMQKGTQSQRPSKSTPFSNNPTHDIAEEEEESAPKIATATHREHAPFKTPGLSLSDEVEEDASNVSEEEDEGEETDI